MGAPIAVTGASFRPTGRHRRSLLALLPLHRAERSSRERHVLKLKIETLDHEEIGVFEKIRTNEMVSVIRLLYISTHI